MTRKFSLLFIMLFAAFSGLGFAQSSAVPRSASPIGLYGAMIPQSTSDQDAPAFSESYLADRVSERLVWSPVQYAAVISAAREFLRIEPLSVFVLGALLLIVATSLRLKIARRSEKATSLRLSRNAPR
jgi:hypothetical protein